MACPLLTCLTWLLTKDRINSADNQARAAEHLPCPSRPALRSVLASGGLSVLPAPLSGPLTLVHVWPTGNTPWRSRNGESETDGVLQGRFLGAAPLVIGHRFPPSTRIHTRPCPSSSEAKAPEFPSCCPRPMALRSPSRLSHNLPTAFVQKSLKNVSWTYPSWMCHLSLVRALIDTPACFLATNWPHGNCGTLSSQILDNQSPPFAEKNLPPGSLLGVEN